MIKVYVKDKTILIVGHAGFDKYGKDIVCAGASGIVITSINAALRLEDNSLIYKEEDNKLTIEIKTNNKNVLLVMENMVEMLKELSLTYKKNIKIIEEEER